MKRELLTRLVCVLLLALPIAGFGQAPNLGTASTFALFTVNGAFNVTGAAVVTGDVGTSAGAFNGFTPGTITGQIRLPNSAEATQAAVDVVAAYSALSGVTCGPLIAPVLGNGQVLTPGVYCQNTAAASSLVNKLTLNGPGVYIIKLNSALTATTGSSISLANGACINDVYFQVNGAFAMETNSTFRGTILANGAISLASGATLEGRGLSIGGAISITDNTVTAFATTLAVAVTPGTCNTATNAYTLTGTVSLSGATTGTLTITDGPNTTTASVTAGQTSVGFSLPAQPSGTGTRSVVVTGPGCSSASIAYSAPASCTTAAPVPATLGGIAYADINANGIQDGGDTPIAGVIVTLLDATSLPIVSVTTGPEGTYSFTGLAANTPYSLSFTAPAGFAAATPAGGITGPLTLTAGQNNTSASAGFAPVTSTLGGSVFSDNNANGIQDGGDTPIAGVTVTLLSNVSTSVISTITSPAGTYSFTGLTVGPLYSVSFTAPSGFTGTTSNVGADATDSDGAPATGLTGTYSLTLNQANLTVGMGYIRLTPTLTLGLFVNKSVAPKSDVLTYTIVVTNSGNAPASNVVVRDSLSAGLSYVANSAVVPAGAVFTPGLPISTLSIASLGAGQSLSLTFQATADSPGILYNTVTIPGDTVRVCSSIPVKLCAGDEYVLSVPPGSISYQWFRNGVIIPGQTTNELLVNAPGFYSLGVDMSGNQCPNFSCCPFIVEADTIPVFQAVAVAATCVGTTVLNNARIVLSGFNAANTYQFSPGTTFDVANVISGAPQLIPANGVITSTLANPVATQSYTVRVTNSAGCFTDVTVTLTPTVCVCPAEICVPFVVRKTRGLVIR